MLCILVFILVLVSIASITLLILTKKEIRKISKELSEINHLDTNQKINLSFNSKELKSLVNGINYNLDKVKSTKIKYKNIDLELRRAIANISHDLRTPLTSIKGYIQLIKREDTSKEEKDKYLDIIEKRASNLESLINSFYELSRLQANEYSLNLEEVNISKLLCDTIASFYDDFVSMGLEPNFYIDENIPKIISDKNSVIRIYNNLIQNVIKHAKGYLSITLKRKDNFIITEFINDAENINSEDINHLFDRFFTVDRMRTGRNTGLGLAIIKTLVERLGNKINAKLENGRLVISIIWNIKIELND